MSATPLTLQQQYDILYVRRHESVLYRGGVAPNEQLFNKITNETGVPLDTVKLAFDRRVNFRIDDPNFRTYFDLIKMGKRVNLQETKQELYKGITEQKPSETTTESRIYQPSKYEQLMSELNEIKPFDERVSHLLKEWGEKLYFIEVRMRHKDPHDERLINFSKSMNQKYQEQFLTIPIHPLVIWGGYASGWKAKGYQVAKETIEKALELHKVLLSELEEGGIFEFKVLRTGNTEGQKDAKFSGVYLNPDRAPTPVWDMNPDIELK